MIKYNKEDIKDELSLENIFTLLQEWGGDPEYTGFGIISATICHNKPGEGSKKLYFYSNSNLFQCYTGCSGYFDIFELVEKVAEIQWGQEYDLNDAVRWIARRFGISGISETDDEVKQTQDWKRLAEYDRINEVKVKEKVNVELNEYDSKILQRFNYNVKISSWLYEGIHQDVMSAAQIGYYPGNNQITIPHFDAKGRLVGIRGRTLVEEDAELYGKYRPLKINKVLYNHPLGMNLYGLNWNKEAIKRARKAIVFESEKSVLLYASYFGWDNNISVACCGSSLSTYQVQLLIDLGVKEIIIAFDRQFQELGDNETKILIKKYKKFYQKYKNFVNISFIFDKNMITGYKASPIDEGSQKFLKLFKERVIL